MMPLWFRNILDAVLPPKEDVQIAQALSDEDYLSVFHPQSACEAWITALFPYRDIRIRSLVRSVKFYGERAPLPIIGRLVGEYAFEVIAEKKQMAGWETPLLVPMPISKERFRERGYNQVERFADAMLPYLAHSVVYTPKALARKERQSQTHIPRAQRLENARGAFFVTNGTLVSGKQIILLDDVVESGATMKDARRALTEAGAAGVIGIAIAH